MSVQPVSADLFRAEKTARLENWRTAHLAASEHLRHCTSCTVVALCPLGFALEEMVSKTEVQLNPWELRRIERAMFIQHDVPADDDDRPSWLDWLAIVTVGALLLGAAAVGFLFGKGAGL